MIVVLVYKVDAFILDLQSSKYIATSELNFMSQVPAATTFEIHAQRLGLLVW